MRKSKSVPAFRTYGRIPGPLYGPVDMLDPIIGNARRLRELNAQHTRNAMVARLIFDARAKAGWDQAELAKRIGSRQPAVSRVENAIGHTPGMLSRIFKALGKHLNACLAQTKGQQKRQLERIVRDAIAYEPKRKPKKPR